MKINEFLEKYRYVGRWSPFFFYTPIVIYFCWAWLTRGMWTFLDANPGMIDSGLIDDQKCEMQDLFQNMKGRLSLKTTVITSEQTGKLNHFREFMIQEELSYPVVLKPNRGLRGLGVKFIASESQALKYLNEANYDTIVQEFCRYTYEAGVSFCVDPQSKKIKVCSVAIKYQPEVIGDGKSSIEQLFINHPQLKFSINEFKDYDFVEWKRVLEMGESYLIHVPPCTTLGAHIVDITAQVKGNIKWIEENSRVMFDRGIHVGRFDLKFDTIQGLMDGQVKLLEVNGATAEPISVYDPEKSIFQAYTEYFRQINRVFDVGHFNRGSGASNNSAISFAFKLFFYFTRKSNLIAVDEMDFDWSETHKILSAKPFTEFDDESRVNFAVESGR